MATTYRTEVIESYFSDLNKNAKQLTPQETIDFFYEGNIQAVINGNLRLVITIAKKYQGCSTLSLEDLISEGNIGLIKSAESFDPTLGFSFTAYACKTIECTIKTALSNIGHIVRTPYHIRDQWLYAASLSDKASNKDNDDTTYESIIASEERTDKGTEEQDLKEVVKMLLKYLSPIERKVIIESFGIGTNIESSYDIIAHNHRYTNTRIRQIRAEAIRKLKDIAKKKGYKI